MAPESALAESFWAKSVSLASFNNLFAQSLEYRLNRLLLVDIKEVYEFCRSLFLPTGLNWRSAIEPVACR
ncbi:hypothetical protein [Microcoleus sp. FACHB-68]|uniref:hypothetical protein n=1 Tax=Microcoleus sp. FACHB-68 TaxID=2692826 RepID=UPI00168648B7|nr:hypothetical protein [Microcoleus sp. FACHB-68]MBD1940093.1 hypothetical protein [Microcoleus sp. FACHB-68]